MGRWIGVAAAAAAVLAVVLGFYGCLLAPGAGGGRIVVLAHDEEGQRVVMVNARGYGRRVLMSRPPDYASITGDQGMLAHLSAAPDGKRFVVVEQGHERAQLHLFGANGRPSATLRIDDNASVPAWSADGSTMALFSQGSGRTSVWVIRNGAEPEALAGFEGVGTVQALALSPDGREAVVETQRTEGDGTVRDRHRNIATLHRGPAEARGTWIPLLETAGRAFPAWKPDGAEIAWIGGTHNDPEAALRGSPSGTGPGRVLISHAKLCEAAELPGAAVEGLSWSPDGAHLSVVVARTTGMGFDQEREERRIVVVKAATGEAWKIGEGFSDQPSWIPDGGRLVFTGLMHQWGLRKVLLSGVKGGSPSLVLKEAYSPVALAVP